MSLWLVPRPYLEKNTLQVYSPIKEARILVTTFCPLYSEIHPFPVNHKNVRCISKEARAALSQSLCEHHYSLLHYLTEIMFFLLRLTKMNANKLTQRKGQDFLWHHQVLPPLCIIDAHPTEARSQSEARSSTRQQQHAASQHFPTTRAPYVHDCWARVMLLCTTAKIHIRITSLVLSITKNHAIGKFLMKKAFIYSLGKNTKERLWIY